MNSHDTFTALTSQYGLDVKRATDLVNGAEEYGVATVLSAGLSVTRTAPGQYGVEHFDPGVWAGPDYCPPAGTEASA